MYNKNNFIMNKTRKEMVIEILRKSKSPDTVLILAISETNVVEEIYCALFNIE